MSFYFDEGSPGAQRELATARRGLVRIILALVLGTAAMLGIAYALADCGAKRDFKDAIERLYP